MPDDVMLALLDRIKAIVGTTGSGKTYTAKGDVEQLLATPGRRVCVADPLGVWWGLRLKADGVTPAFPITVLGGSHGDVPIDETMGGRIAHIIATRDINTVIDLSGIRGHAARRRFMTDFAEVLYEENKRPLHLVLDECDLWVPQRPRPEQLKLLGLIDEIVRRGRTRGFIPMLISQRPAVIHKDVLGMAQVLVAMQLTLPHDQKAIKSWIEQQASVAEAREMMAALPGLQRGEGYVYAPIAKVLRRVQFPLIATYDSSRTPEHGEVIGDVTLPPIDMAGMVAALAPEQKPEPETKAGKPSVDALAAARREGFDAGARSRDEEVLALQDRERELLAVIRGTLSYVAPYAERKDGVPTIVVQRPPRPVTIEISPARRAPPPAAPGQIKTPSVMVDGKLVAGAKALLATIAAHHPARLTWTQVATLGGRKASGGHFNTSLKSLRGSGFIEEGSDGRVALTAAGAEDSGGVEPAPATREGLIGLWCKALPSPAPDILAMLDTMGGATTIEHLAKTLNRKPIGGHWNTGMSHLRANGLVKVDGRNIKLSEVFE